MCCANAKTVRSFVVLSPDTESATANEIRWIDHRTWRRFVLYMLCAQTRTLHSLLFGNKSNKSFVARCEKVVLRAIVSLVNQANLRHLFLMLDVLRRRERLPERTLSNRELRSIAKDIRLPPTPANLLALMLAIGTGRFVRIEFGNRG